MYYIARTRIKDTVFKEDYRFILIVLGKDSNFFSYKNEIQNQINK